MTCEAIVEILRRHQGPLMARGVTHLGLFGSAARGDSKPESDIDVVVDIADPSDFSLVDHASLRVFLRDILGKETDVVVAAHLAPGFRNRVASERVEVF
ncbi:MAG: nucleotidyltransferase domain-containing protein [Magnetospirillum sp. WYHS-4]